MRAINIGLLGFGTVGAGLAKLLMENGDVITARLGARLVLKKVVDIDTQTDRGIALPPGTLSSDAATVIDNPDIDIVVEMIGGQTVAKKLMLAAIAKGKHVVTANKALLATSGTEIFQAAHAKGVDVAYEASCGGCMPVVKTLRESLVGTRVQAMRGILNGTCNYILTKISADGSPFKEALADAQKLGYAEADPTLDVDGHDTAHKLAILTSLAYGTVLNLTDIYVEGISQIDPMDIRYAAEEGYCIKLLAISKNSGDTIDARVHPAMIPKDHLLSSINGRVNAVVITADAVGDIMLYGYGAGMMPTGSAVVADCVDLARNLLYGKPNRVPFLGYQMDEVRPIAINPIQAISTHYYVRFSALDQPGVLSTISGVLGDHKISIKTVHQKGRKNNGAVPVFIQTHQANEADIQNALTIIQQKGVVDAKPVLIRIEDERLDN